MHCGTSRCPAARAAYKKRLQAHLKETKAQSRALERRIKQLGKASVVELPGPLVATAAATGATKVANKASAARHRSRHCAVPARPAAQERQDRARERVPGDRELRRARAREGGRRTDTAKLARDHRREEERMAAFPPSFSRSSPRPS